MDRMAHRRKPGLWSRIVDFALAGSRSRSGVLDDAAFERLEEALIEADFSVGLALDLVEAVRRSAERGGAATEGEVRDLLRGKLESVLDSCGPASAGKIARSGKPSGAARPREMPRRHENPESRGNAGASGNARSSENAGSGENAGALRRGSEIGVVLLVGVNGAGKTTAAAKLARRLQEGGDQVLLAAADTFRAGAQEQLRVWADRLGADFVGGKPGSDPAAVAFSAVTAAQARGAQWVLVDTAGRLHTHGDLMTEVAKIDRVLGSRAEGAPHERLLVVDATSGQNIMNQARSFGETVGLTGIFLAKFDSTARAGAVVSIVRELSVPVRFIGFGESADDLEDFSAARYLDKIFASEPSSVGRDRVRRDRAD